MIMIKSKLNTERRELYTTCKDCFFDDIRFEKTEIYEFMGMKVYKADFVPEDEVWIVGKVKKEN